MKLFSKKLKDGGGGYVLFFLNNYIVVFVLFLNIEFGGIEFW